MNPWVPVLVAFVSGLFAAYAALQARGTERGKREIETASIGQTYTENYLKRLEARVDRLETDRDKLREENYTLREVNHALREEITSLKDRLRKAGIE